MAEFEKVIGTITVNKNILQVDNQFVGNMFSSDLTYTVNFSDDFWDGFDILEWYAASSVVGETVVCEYDSANKKLKIPYGAYIKNGPLYLSLRGIKDSVKYASNILVLLVGENINIEENDIVNDPSWLDKVQAIIDDVFVSKYDPQYEVLVQKVEKQISANKELLDKTQEQQNQIDNAIDIMGDYEIVQEDPVQIRFKKGDGTYGDTVNLGDNLASKSMVNAGYDTYSGSSYSGSASDYGIEIAKASGNYKQVETNGYQLFDASKLPTKSAGGAIVTNNGDGSFTVTGNGLMSGDMSSNFIDVTDEVLSQLKVGKIYANFGAQTYPYCVFKLGTSPSDTITGLSGFNSLSDEVEITEDILSRTTKVYLQFYGVSGQNIVPGTIKPMIYQDGDGTWEPFTGGEPSPNPNYAQYPKFFEPKNIASSGNNLYSLDNFVDLNENFTIDDDGWFVVHHTNNTGGIEFLNIYHKPITELKKNSDYYFTIEHEKNVFSNNPTLYINSLDPNAVNNSQFENGNVTFKFDSDNKIVLLTTKENFDSSQYLLRTYLYIPNGSSIDFKFRITLSPIENANFETYKPIYTTPLSLILRALPNGVCDTYENGVITRRVGYIEFDGSEDEDFIFRNQAESPLVQIYVNGVKGNTNNQSLAGYLCNKLKELTPDNLWSSIEVNRFSIGVNDGSKCFFSFRVDGVTESIESFKTWLQSNPIKVWYELATPTTEEVELPIIPSYFPYTNAWHDSKVEASDLTWNILAGQYGSGQTTIKKDEAVLTELDLNTERTVSPTTVKVQLKDTSGNTFYVETSADNVYLKGTDGSEISQKNLNDKIGQLINLVAFYSANPTTVLADLKKYITTIS